MTLGSCGVSRISVMDLGFFSSTRLPQITSRNIDCAAVRIGTRSNYYL